MSSELYHISGVRTRVQKVKPKMAEFEEQKDVNPSPLRGQRTHKNTSTIQNKESKMDHSPFKLNLHLCKKSKIFYHC